MNAPENPYAAPQFQPPPPPERLVSDNPKPLPKLQKSFLKWTLACAVAAGPSFFIAIGLVHKTGFAAACAGMTAAIIVFVVLYVFIERTRRVQRILSMRFARRTAWIGYGTRVAVSIIFPIGIGADMLCGIFAVGISQSIIGNEKLFMHREVVADGAHVGVFLNFFFTTIVQGVTLNVVLFGYMTAVFGICHLIAGFAKPR